MGYFKRKKPRNQHSSSSEKNTDQFIKPQATLMAIGSKDAAEKEDGNVTSNDASQEKEEAAVGSADAQMNEEEGKTTSTDASKEEEPAVDSADAQMTEEEGAPESKDQSQEEEPQATSKDAAAPADEKETVASMDAGAATSETEQDESGHVSMTSSTPIKQTYTTNETATDDSPVTRRIPDQQLTGSIATAQDKLTSTISHIPTVNQSGAVGASEYGITSAGIALTNMNVTSSGKTHTVTADLKNTITWQVHANVGPAGEKNITDENDGDITAANYQTVSDDLKPNAYGRPDRNSYWSKSITERHEKFHAYKQYKDKFGPKVNKSIQRWLNKQKVASAANINATLMSNAKAEGITTYLNLAALPSTEGDAYKDGKPEYKKLSRAIKKKGKSGGY
jgi:hypothetical protein